MSWLTHTKKPTNSLDKNTVVLAVPLAFRLPWEAFFFTTGGQTVSFRYEPEHVVDTFQQCFGIQ